MNLASFFMAVPLLRILVSFKGFLDMTHSLVHGLQIATPFILILVIVHYMFCVFCYASFSENIQKNGHLGGGFSTYGHTFLTMFQVFIGAGWATVMEEAINQTYTTFYWLFLTYRLLVGVIVTQFMISILVEAFQEAEENRTSMIGAVRHEIGASVPEMLVLTAVQRDKVDREVGALARRLLKMDDRSAIIDADAEAEGDPNFFGHHHKEMESVFGMQI